MGIIKFGPVSTGTQLIKGKRVIGYYTNQGNVSKIKKYLKGLKCVNSSYKIEGYIEPSGEVLKKEEISKKDFIFSICTRTPLHIASIQCGNLIPFQNVVHNFEEFTSKLQDEAFLDSLTDYIRFGNFENIMDSLEKVLVFSIIGRQSSGKSYLLNRLTGSRFDVAAERCTDGI